MIRPQLTLDLNAELFIDNFAGGGGASTGIERALGRHVDHAINHSFEALGMHRINHPQTVHHCEDVFDVDPEVLAEGRRIGAGWFSPDCKHFSKAKGGKPLDKKIRGLVLVMIRYAAAGTRVMFMENVEEIRTWGPLMDDGRPDPAHKGRTWKALLAILGEGIDPDHPDLPMILEVLAGTITEAQCVEGFGYDCQVKEIRACDHGAPTIRRRLFMVARCDGQPIVWPKATHAGPNQIFKAGDKKLKPWRTIAECIDWNLACPSIFLTKAEAKRQRCRRPLATSTLRRIATGVDRYVLKAEKPFLVSLTHQGGDRVEAIDEPVRTLTGAHRGEKALVVPEVAPFITEHANSTHQRNMPADEPIRTQCANVKGGHFATVSANLMRQFGNSVGQGVDFPSPTVLAGGGGKTALVAGSLVKMRGDNIGYPADEPGHTISAGGTHHGLSCAYLAQHNGGFNETPGHDAREPITSITGTGSQQQVVMGSLAAYYGNDQDGQAVDEPARTVTTKERFGFVESTGVTPRMTDEQIAGARRVAAFLREYGCVFEGEFATVAGYVIVDIGMRMLTPRELFRAQGFPEDYVIDRAWVIDPKTGDLTEIRLTKEQQIRMCGNSVCPPVAEALVRVNVPELSVWFKGERKGVAA